MAALLGDSNILSKLDADVRANEIFYHSGCQKKFERRHDQLLSDKKDNRDVSYKNAIAFERAIAVLKGRASEAPDIPIVVREIGGVQQLSTGGRSWKLWK